MLKIIKELAKELNNKNVTWAIGGSHMLHRYGIVDNSNIIDIMVTKESIITAIEVMNGISEKLDLPNQDHFQTEYFSAYNMNGIQVNLISNFKCDFTEEFIYDFDQVDIQVSKDVSNESIYYCYLMDWYIIYNAVNRKDMIALIEEHYENGGFLDNARFKHKFNKLNHSSIINKYSELKHRIY